MPAIGNIVINDGAGTPVAHTFGPVTIDGTVAKYADRVGGIPVGYPVIWVDAREPKSGSALWKSTMTIMVPTLEQTSPSTASGIQPAPTVAYFHTTKIDWLFPVRGTLQERKNQRSFTVNLLAHATVISVLENMEAVY